ncbi:MAG: cyclodeaminase/cyclohydrolase family protein [Planctomycetia bacterium]|nr:MAG: cyclodeaminase/cyclohydrolase family protein [Planctomycetia bacterium]
MSERRLTGLTVHEFLEALAARQETPGGGSVAALCGALAASLGRMAAAFTTDSPRFADVAERVTEIAGRLARAGHMLSELIDEDAAAYLALSAAFKRDKGDPDRSAVIRTAATLAAAVPFQVAVLSRKVRLDLARLAPIANPNLASDVECGLHLAAAAMHSAAVNVRVNLRLLGAPESERIERELAAILGAGGEGLGERPSEANAIGHGGV